MVIFLFVNLGYFIVESMLVWKGIEEKKFYERNYFVMVSILMFLGNCSNN